MKPKGKRMLAWLLTTTVIFSANSFTVLAGEMDFTDVQEVSVEDQIQTETNELEDTAVDEVQFEDEFQSEETEEPVVEEENQGEEENGSGEVEAIFEDTEEEPFEEEAIFSAGDEANALNPEEYTEDYYLPENEILLVDWDYWVSRWCDGYVQDDENPDGRDFEFTITDLQVSNADGEKDESPVCEINYQDENGWNIQTRRTGTAVVRLTYDDLRGEQQQYEFNLLVNGDKYILEPQWSEAGNCMLRNSSMKLPFVLRHEWKYSDEEVGEEEIKNWTLSFASDENGWKYDTDLLKSVKINGHELTVNSKDNSWGTAILLKAMIPDANGKLKEVIRNNVYIEVRDEYDVLYPENIENVNVGEVLNFNNCGLKVAHVREDGTSYIRKDVSYEIEHYDTNLWTSETSKGKLPILKRKEADGTQINVVARDKDGNEICRREYWFDGLDYSVWFENQRENENSTYFFENETGELRLNTENLKDKKNVSIEWEMGYKTEQDENGNDRFTRVPAGQTFWSAKKGDNSVLTINGTKLCKADKWLEASGKGNYWFEARAHIKINGIEVFICPTDLWGKENIEEYHLNFGTTLETVPGEIVWLDQAFDCYVENSQYPWGETLSVDISKVRTLNKNIYSITHLKNGWRMKAEKSGKTKVEITYKDIHGKQQKGFFDVSVKGASYWCNYLPKDNVDSILPNGEKQYTLSVYCRTAKNPDGVKVDSSKYKFEIIKDSYDKDLVKSVNITGNTLTIKVKEAEDREVSVGLRAVSKSKNANNNPQWTAETEVYGYLVREYSAQIKLGKIIDVNPDVGKTFNLKAYSPYVVRYNSKTKKWQKLQDSQNIRIRLEYDKNIWKAVNNNELPVLKRIDAKRSFVRVFAEEKHTNRYGKEVWETIAEDSYFFFTVFDKNEKCSHIWETVRDSEPTCGKAGKQHQECTACQTKKAYSDIPATGKHKWGKYTVTKKATVFAQGQETRICSVCKKKETRKTAKLKAALNLSAYTFPIQQGNAITIKSSGLKNGDYVKLVSSSKSSVLKAVKLKNGDIRLTAPKSSRKNKVTVKVLVKTAGGAGRTITVTVQSGKVRTSKITGVSKSLTIKRGKTAVLKPVRNPVTSQDKVTYTSSNKKIATVDSKGTIKGIALGRAVITVKSGTVSFKCTVNIVK